MRAHSVSKCMDTGRGAAPRVLANARCAARAASSVSVTPSTSQADFLAVASGARHVRPTHKGSLSPPCDMPGCVSQDRWWLLRLPLHNSPSALTCPSLDATCGTESPEPQASAHNHRWLWD